MKWNQVGNLWNGDQEALLGTYQQLLQYIELVYRLYKEAFSLI
jgi:hypothetical protein